MISQDLVLVMVGHTGGSRQQSPFEAKSIPFCGGYRLEGNRSPQSAGP